MADIIRTGMLCGYDALVRSFGGDPDLLLAEAGLSRDLLGNPDCYISRRLAADLLERTAGRLDCPDFGLQLAGMQDANILGALAFAVRLAPDLGSAIRTAERYAYFQCPSLQLSRAPVRGAAEDWLILSWGPDKAAAEVQFVEHAICMAHRMASQLTGGVVRLTRIRFAHARVGELDAYRRALGLVPEFGRDFNAVANARKDLPLPLKHADPRFQAIVQRYLDRHAADSRQQIVGQVRQAIARSMRDSGKATALDVAAMLRMHPRTLQRRLAGEGASFEQFRDDARRELAEVYLADDAMPIAQVAHSLGYAGQSALTRSCLRWFGRTPLQMRKWLAGQSGRPISGSPG